MMSLADLLAADVFASMLVYYEKVQNILFGSLDWKSIVVCHRKSLAHRIGLGFLAMWKAPTSAA